jgi:transketolase
MRAAFVQTLIELAEKDSRIILLTADLGFMAFEPFIEKFPDRFINVGVAEQNMIGIATGLAEGGFIPFAYSIVGVGGGFEYGAAGVTHHGLEDVGIMRIQPGISIMAPADAAQTRTVFRATWDLPTPIYYRIGKNDSLVVAGLDGRFELGRVQIIREGKDVLLLTMGAIAEEAVLAAQKLVDEGIEATIGVIASVVPPPVDDLLHLLCQFRLTFTLEAHSVVGGIGSLVAEVIADHNTNSRLVRCGVDKLMHGFTGSQAYLNKHHGLSAAEFAATIRREFQKV